MKILATLLLVVMGACLKSPVPEDALERAPDGILLFEIAVPEAEVWRHGQFLGEASDFASGMALSPGEHRIVFVHEDFYESYHSVEIRSGKTSRIKVTLLPRL